AKERLKSVAEQLGLDLPTAAEHVRDAAADAIAEAILGYAVGRAVDPASVTVVASGGLGGVLAPAVADRLGAENIIAGHAASVAGALGLLNARHVQEHVLPINKSIDALGPENLPQEDGEASFTMEVAPDPF